MILRESRSIMIKLHLLLFLLLLISCGKGVKEDTDDDVRLEESPDGTYSAVLAPVNHKFSGDVYGEVRIHKYGDEFKVNIRLKNAPKINYRQYLQTGSFCPQMSQDLNADGYLDAVEARNYAGSIIVPFDEDLSAQRSGDNIVLQGNYNYSKSTSYYLMLSDLHLPDDVVNDGMVKLEGKELPLERKTVLIYGQGKNLPSTFMGQEVPVACGILSRISQYPIPDDEIEEAPQDSSRTRRRPRPRAEPREPEPRPDPPPAPRSRTWWERIRDWWTGGPDPSEEM